MLIYNAEQNDAGIPDAKTYHVYNLSWTTEPPKETGVYQAVPVEMDEPVTWVEVTHIKKGGFVCVFGIDVYYEFKDFTHWLGPLPVAELPQKGA